jgi:hypothetical protein
MKARPHLTAAAFDPQPNQATSNDKPEEQKQDQIDLEQDKNGLGVCAERR